MTLCADRPGASAGPLISVVIPTYNRARLLPRAIDSILRQTCSNWELIVVNDASSDNTVAVLQEYQERLPDIKVVTLLTNGGAGRARNVGVKHARGTYIAFLDDDDAAVNTRLENQLAFLTANPAVDLCFGLIQRLNDPSQHQVARPLVLVRNEIPTDPSKLFGYLLRVQCVTTPTIALKASVMLQHQFAEDVAVAEDMYFVLSVAASGVSIRGIPVVLTQVDRATMREGLSEDRQRVYCDHMKVLQRVFIEQNVSALLQRQTMASQLAFYAEYLDLPPLQSLRMIIRSVWLWPLQKQWIRAVKHLIQRR